MQKRNFLILFFILVSLLLVLSGCGRLRDRHNADDPSNVEQIDEQEILNNIIEPVLDPGDYRFIIEQEDKERYYLLHVPDSYDGSTTPLILAFHGGMGTAEIMRDYYNLVEKSDKEGFIVAFPNGASRFDSGKIATWNAGRCCAYAVESESDDVGFVRMIIKDIKKKVNVEKIFATGMSNGGMLSHRLACEMSDVFTAIAAVAGTNNYDGCNPKQPISVLHIHGLLDDHVLFEGGCGPECKVNAETEFTSVPDTISDWIEKNNCDDSPERVFEDEKAYCDLYSGCEGNVQVKLCVAEEGAHSWPGAAEKPNPLETTQPSQAFSATDMIWDFFKTK